MKKIGVNRIVFLLSLLFNVGAGFIYFQWVMNTYEINEYIKEVKEQFGLFCNSSNEYYRVCYADKACVLAAMDDGTYFFHTTNFGDMISFGLMLGNQINDSDLRERRYMLAGRNFVTSWKYKDDGRCYDVIYQYNGGCKMRDVLGDGVFKQYLPDKKLNYSERAYEETVSHIRTSN